MDTLDSNTNRTKSNKFDKNVHDTMKKLNNVHSKTTTHSTINNNSKRKISSSGSSIHNNETKEDVQHSTETNNNNLTRIVQNNAKDCNDACQNGSRTGANIEQIQLNSTKTNGYVNGHSHHSHCTIVQNFQNYHKPSR